MLKVIWALHFVVVERRFRERPMIELRLARLPDDQLRILVIPIATTSWADGLGFIWPIRKRHAPMRGSHGISSVTFAADVTSHDALGAMPHTCPNQQRTAHWAR